jgi:hypothetical protein
MLRAHHDALEFPDGTCVLLTILREGQEATVLQLPAQPRTPAEEKVQTRAHHSGAARAVSGLSVRQPQAQPATVVLLCHVLRLLCCIAGAGRRLITPTSVLADG